MIRILACVCALLLVAGIAQSQTKSAATQKAKAATKPDTKAAPKLPPGRTLAPVVKKQETYADSVKFKAAFAQLYTILRPKQTIRERTEQEFKRMSRSFKAHGVDSAIAHDKVMKAIDPEMDEKILFKTYRKEFSADELKTLVAFLKTPSGQKYLAAQPRLLSAESSQVSQYVSSTINGAVAPLMKPVDHSAAMTMPNRPRPMTSPANIRSSISTLPIKDSAKIK